jgi:tripartite-type tricarboxylate transporter receptor subunit TctC
MAEQVAGRGLRRRRWMVGTAAAVVFTGMAFPAQAEVYPSRPITMVVPFPPGGSADAGARIVAQGMSERLGVAVVVDNKPGANAGIGSAYVAKAKPDGYTVLYNTSTITLNAALYEKLPFDYQRELTPVGLSMVVPLALVVPSSMPVTNVKEFLDYARSKGDALTYGSAGNGNITHLAAFQLMRAAGLAVTHVPYKGSGPANLDLVTGRIDFMTDTVNNLLAFHRDGRLRILAVTTDTRLGLLPDVPTFAEAGIPDVGSGAWSGVMAPAGTPAAVIDKLNTSLREALASAAVREKIAQLGAEPLGGTAAHYEQFLAREQARWADVVKASGISLQ